MPARTPPPTSSLQASIAAHASWARTPDRPARLAPAHEARDRRIARDYGIPAELEQTDPAEYVKRLESAKKAYFGKLALKSVKARAAKRAAPSNAGLADAS